MEAVKKLCIDVKVRIDVLAVEIWSIQVVIITAL